jgi:hypothetical protein
MFAPPPGQPRTPKFLVMLRAIHISGIALLLLVATAGAGMMPTAAGESPEQVTTDTLSYCRQLAARVDQLESGGVKPPAAAVNLSLAGRQMCEHGGIRGGIMRLRSAIVMLLHPPAASNAIQTDGTE